MPTPATPGAGAPATPGRIKKVWDFLKRHKKKRNALLVLGLACGIAYGGYKAGTHNLYQSLFKSEIGHVEHNGRTLDVDYEKEVEGDRLFEARLEKDCCGGLLVKLYTKGDAAIYHTRIHDGLETTLSDVLSTVEQGKLKTVMYECLKDIKTALAPIAKENGEPLGFLRTYIENKIVKTELYLVVGVKNAIDPNSKDCGTRRDYELVKLDIEIMEKTQELHARKVSDKIRVSD